MDLETKCCISNLTQIGEHYRRNWSTSSLINITMNGSGDDGKDSTLQSKRWSVRKKMKIRGKVTTHNFVLEVFYDVLQTITMNSFICLPMAHLTDTLSPSTLLDKEHWHTNEFARFSTKSETNWNIHSPKSNACQHFTPFGP